MLIADVRFRLTGTIGADSFAAPFAPFLQNENSAADGGCVVDAMGPDPALAAWPAEPQRPWTFTQNAEGCEVVRRDSVGRVLWRVVGTANLDQAKVTWHPTLFAARYVSYRRAWSTGLGLVIVGLRLRTLGGLLLHGMAAQMGDVGILGVGVSGVGKSTLSRILATAGLTVLTDERPVVRPRGADGFRVYGTPWPSSAGIADNNSVPLRRIYLLEHGATNAITPLKPQEVVPRLIPVTTIAWQAPDLLGPSLATLSALVREIPCARLTFRPDASVIPILQTDLQTRCA